MNVLYNIIFIGIFASQISLIQHVKIVFNDLQLLIVVCKDQPHSRNNNKKTWDYYVNHRANFSDFAVQEYFYLI